MRQFILGMICGATLLYTAMHYHLVRGNEGVVLVPKLSNTLSGAYVDIREFGLQEWKDHKPLAAAIMKSNQSHLLEDAGEANFGNSVRGMVDNLFQTRE